MDGQIKVESEKGKGTTFTVTFPAIIAKPLPTPSAV
jgi:signal transduction histidine kinase